MVRINKQTWITPTTYGSVISQITSDHDLLRVYLDDEASLMLSNKSKDVMSQVKNKGVDLTGFDDNSDKFIQERNICISLAKKNHWHLFSLSPLQYSVQTINYCNANCDFCYANVPNTKKRQMMDKDVIFKLKDYAADHGVKFGVSGGEPLLHPDLFEILEYKANDVYDTLITNLTAPLDIDRLIATDVDLIQVSIHGYGSDHDRILGIKNAYNLIFQRMDRLLDEINVATNTVITPETINRIPDIVKDLFHLQKKHEKRLNYLRFVPVVPSGTGLHRYPIKDDFLDQVKTLLRRLEDKFPEIIFEIPMLHANPYEYYFVDNTWICPAGSTVAVIRIDGHVLACNQFLDTSICSKDTIFEKSLQHIWQQDTVLSEMRKGMDADKELTCSECRYLLMNKDK